MRPSPGLIFCTQMQLAFRERGGLILQWEGGSPPLLHRARSFSNLVHFVLLIVFVVAVFVVIEVTIALDALAISERPVCLAWIVLPSQRCNDGFIGLSRCRQRQLLRGSA